MQTQLDALVRRLDACERRIGNQDVIIREQEVEIHSLKGRIREQDVEIMLLKGRIRDKEGIINSHIIQFKSLRQQTRDMAYGQMLNAFVNVVKFACYSEPKPEKGRRNSTLFQNKGKKEQLRKFLQIVYPGRKMTAVQVQHYFKHIDSLKDQRDRITHPRTIVELAGDVNRFAGMLQDHQNIGDELNAEEKLFFEVFSKFDDLRASGVGNLNH